MYIGAVLFETIALKKIQVNDGVQLIPPLGLVHA